LPDLVPYWAAVCLWMLFSLFLWESRTGVVIGK
jgi:hypothetical protein